MSDLIQWLNANANAVMAAAAVVTAAATALIGVLTGGTIALYRLERRREGATRGRIAAHLWRLQNHFKTAADMLEEVRGQDPDMATSGKDVARFIIEENGRRSLEMNEALREATSTTMRAMASLDAARLLLPAADDLARQIVNWPGGHPSLRGASKHLVDELRDISGVLRTGYESIPAEDRRWGSETDPYDKVIANVVEPVRDQRRLRGGG